MDIELDTPTLPSALLTAKNRIEGLLKTWLPVKCEHSTLTEAMRYSALNGGKRLRSALIYAIQDPFSIPQAACDHIAAAIECVHASSLIHDDLPALDDDDLRRGQPACHIVYGEAMAILAGDGLMNFAYECLLKLPESAASAEAKLAMMQCLVSAIGEQGMVGGQAREFDSQAKNEAAILELYALKTGALMGAGLQMAAHASPLNSPRLQANLAQLSHHLGLAFQIHDDILDIEGCSEHIGKPQFSDQDENKQTLIALVGMEKAKQLRDHHIMSTKHVVSELALEQTALSELIDFIIQRQF